MDNEYGSQYEIMSEQMLREASAYMEMLGEETSSFKKMVDCIDQYREANLTPIVLYNHRENTFYCIVKELYGKKLH